MNGRARTATWIVVLTLLISACGGPSPGDVAEQSTLDAISAYVRQTSTAVAA